MQAFQTIDEILRHPLFLVLATGLVSAYLIPRFTKRWQDHQKAVESKTRFASEVTEAVVKFLLTVQLAERKSIEQDTYDAAYQEWEVRRATLASELRGQFRNPGIATEWASLSEAVSALYRLSGTFSQPYRGQVLDELRSFFSEQATDWSVMLDHEQIWTTNESFQTYFAAWWKLREAALLKTGDLTRHILESETTSFG